MTPTLEEYNQGATTWRHDYKGVAILLSHHGYMKPDHTRGYFAEGHPGTWCYYLLIPEKMFPHRWDDFKAIRDEHGYESPGPAWEHDWFDTEITFSQSQPQWCRKTNRMWDGIKIGCDYNHSWHRDQGYQDTLGSVKRDAERTVEAFIKANPDRNFYCEYSHLWGVAGDFYTAKNGRRVHNSHREKQIADDTGWQPAEAKPTE